MAEAEKPVQNQTANVALIKLTDTYKRLKDNLQLIRESQREDEVMGKIISFLDEYSKGARVLTEREF